MQIMQQPSLKFGHLKVLRLGKSESMVAQSISLLSMCITFPPFSLCYCSFIACLLLNIRIKYQVIAIMYDPYDHIMQRREITLLCTWLHIINTHAKIVSFVQYLKDYDWRCFSLCYLEHRILVDGAIYISFKRNRTCRKKYYSGPGSVCGRLFDTM